MEVSYPRDSVPTYRFCGSFAFGRVFEFRNPGRTIFEQSLKDAKEEVMRDFKRIRNAALLDMDQQDDDGQTHLARDIEDVVKDILRKLGLPTEANLDVGELPADPVNLFEAIWDKASNLVLSGSLAASPSCARRIFHLARAVEQRREEQWRQTPGTNPLQRVAPYSRRIFPLDELNSELISSNSERSFTERTQQNPTRISGEAVGTWTAPSARYEVCSAEKTELDAVEEETTERSALLRPELPDRVALVKEILDAAEAGEGLCPHCRRVLHSEPFTTSHEGFTCESCFKVILPTSHRPQPQTYSCFACAWSICFDCRLPQEEQRRMIDAAGFHRGFLGPEWHNLHIGVTRFHLAAREGDVQKLKALLKPETGSTDINSQDFSERTPLHDLLCSQQCTSEAVEFMLHHKADVAARDNDNNTPLDLALARGHKEVVDLLIQHGADVAARGKDNNARLHLALARGHKEVVDLFIQHGADVAARDNDNNTPLDLALARGHKEVVDLLIQHGADVAARGKDNNARLHLALARGHKEVVDLFIQHGADVAARDNDNKTPLHVAAFRGHKEVVDLLIQHGADVAARDNDNKTPLHVAAFRGHKEVVDLLIQHGADVAARDNDNKTPLHVAAFWGYKEVVDLLIQHGADVAARDNDNKTPLHVAAFWGHKEVVDLFIQHGADVAARDNDNKTPLHEAFFWGDKEVVDLLIQHGADVAARDNNNKTPLHVAAFRGHKEVVDLLIQHGADVAARDNDNKTPLHVAVFWGYKEVVDLLIQHGADVAARDNDNKTPLHVAAFWGYKEVVDLLIQHGADVAARDNDNKTPLHVAAFWGYKEVVDLLIQHGADAGIFLNCASCCDWDTDSDQPFYSDQSNFIPVANSDSGFSDTDSCFGYCSDDERWFAVSFLQLRGLDHWHKNQSHRRAWLEHDGQIHWVRQPALVASGPWKTSIVFWSLIVACCNHHKAIKPFLLLSYATKHIFSLHYCWESLFLKVKMRKMWCSKLNRRFMSMVQPIIRILGIERINTLEKLPQF